MNHIHTKSIFLFFVLVENSLLTMKKKARLRRYGNRPNYIFRSLSYENALLYLVILGNKNFQGHLLD